MAKEVFMIVDTEPTTRSLCNKEVEFFYTRSLSRVYDSLLQNQQFPDRFEAFKFPSMTPITKVEITLS